MGANQYKTFKDWKNSLSEFDRTLVELMMAGKEFILLKKRSHGYMFLVKKVREELNKKTSKKTLKWQAKRKRK